MNQLIELGRGRVHRAGSAELLVLSAVLSSLAVISTVRSGLLRAARP
jgi:hypothetical protein